MATQFEYRSGTLRVPPDTILLRPIIIVMSMASYLSLTSLITSPSKWSTSGSRRSTRRPMSRRLIFFLSAIRTISRTSARSIKERRPRLPSKSASYMSKPVPRPSKAPDAPLTSLLLRFLNARRNWRPPLKALPSNRRPSITKNQKKNVADLPLLCTVTSSYPPQIIHFVSAYNPLQFQQNRSFFGRIIKGTQLSVENIGERENEYFGGRALILKGAPSGKDENSIKIMRFEWDDLAWPSRFNIKVTYGFKKWQALLIETKPLKARQITLEISTPQIIIKCFQHASMAQSQKVKNPLKREKVFKEYQFC